MIEESRNANTAQQDIVRKAKEERNRYMREYNKRNRERIKNNQMNYWYRKSMKAGNESNEEAEIK